MLVGSGFLSVTVIVCSVSFTFWMSSSTLVLAYPVTIVPVLSLAYPSLSCVSLSIVKGSPIKMISVDSFSMNVMISVLSFLPEFMYNVVKLYIRFGFGLIRFHRHRSGFCYLDVCGCDDLFWFFDFRFRVKSPSLVISRVSSCT